jgi:hypothetical protein
MAESVWLGFIARATVKMLSKVKSKRLTSLFIVAVSLMSWKEGCPSLIIIRVSA